MAATFLITSRETLEAALIVGIILAFLKKTKNIQHNKFVWYGVGAGIVFSIIVAFIFEQIYGGFSGMAEEIYEGVAMLLAAGLITWMIFWMIKQKSRIRRNIENKVEKHIEEDHPFKIFGLVFLSTAREGVETVIFLQAVTLNTEGGTDLFGGILGIAVAVVLGYILYKGIRTMALKHFFNVTGIILILFAAGLVAHGIHELQEAYLIPIINEHLWDINHIVNEKGNFGALMKGLFGYNGNPSLIEVLSYIAYLAFIAFAWKFMQLRSNKGN